MLVSFPAHSQILSHSCGEKRGYENAMMQVWWINRMALSEGDVWNFNISYVKAIFTAFFMTFVK